MAARLHLTYWKCESSTLQTQSLLHSVSAQESITNGHGLNIACGSDLVPFYSRKKKCSLWGLKLADAIGCRAQGYSESLCWTPFFSGSVLQVIPAAVTLSGLCPKCMPAKHREHLLCCWLLNWAVYAPWVQLCLIMGPDGFLGHECEMVDFCSLSWWAVSVTKSMTLILICSSARVFVYSSKCFKPNGSLKMNSWVDLWLVVQVSALFVRSELACAQKSN